MTGTSMPRSYNCPASIGDFLNITHDPATQTEIYTKVSNDDSSVVPYTVNADGTYALNDFHANLVAAYEVPNHALILQAEKTGPNRDVPVLVTAVERGTISVATWAGKENNYMQDWHCRTDNTSGLKWQHHGGGDSHAPGGSLLWHVYSSSGDGVLPACSLPLGIGRCCLRRSGQFCLGDRETLTATFTGSV